MNFQFKEIKIGRLIKEIIDKKEIEENRVTSYLKISERELLKLFESDSIDTDLLLRCCKLLEYDFFRIYSQHLLLYSPFTIHTKEKTVKKGIVSTPVFRKNLYTPEIINFIIELIETKQKTPNQIIKEYRIPKSTLYKWIKKHKTTED